MGIIRNVYNVTAPLIDGDYVSTQACGFNPQGVVVDNYSAYYLYLPEGDVYIAPYWVGATYGLQHTSGYGNCIVKSPYTNVQAPTTTSFFIAFAWTDQPLQYSPGQSIQGTSVPSNVPIPPLNVQNTIDVELLSTYMTVGLVAVPLPATPLINRKTVLLQADPFNSDWIYLGGAGVLADYSAANGMQLVAGASVSLDASQTAIIYGISPSPNQFITVLEGA